MPQHISIPSTGCVLPNNGTSAEANGTLRDDLADVVSIAKFQPFVAGELELAWVEAQLMEKRSMQVGDIMAVFDGVKANFVRGPVHLATPDSAAGHPHWKPA